MPGKEYKRPDEFVMQQVLKDAEGTVAELAIRMAWRVGLSRDEMYHLKWSDIDTSEKKINLPDRTVPLEDEELLCLRRRVKGRFGLKSEYVMYSDRNGTHMAPQSISRVVRESLDKFGLSDITMVDLRHDYVIRLLEKYEWPYVAKISGNAVATLYANYGKYYTKGRGIKLEKDKAATPDEFKLWKLIEEKGSSPEGIALKLAFRYGVKMQESISLTWNQVDFEKRLIALSDRQVQVEPDFMAQLMQVKQGRSAEADPHVLLTPRSQNPYDDARMSRKLRTILIRGGLEDVSFRDLVRDDDRTRETDWILAHAKEHGYIKRNDVMEALGLTQSVAQNRLNALVEQEKLVRIGKKYYMRGVVVPPEEHEEVVRAHLETMGSAYRAELVDLLHVDANQCKHILAKLVKEGKLAKKGQMYVLPERREK